jgi:hypothetical protein
MGDQVLASRLGYSEVTSAEPDTGKAGEI